MCHSLTLIFHLGLCVVWTCCSGGGDNVVNLWRIASCSSAPWLGADMGCIENDEDLEGLEQLDISRTTEADPPDVKVCWGTFYFVIAHSSIYDQVIFFHTVVIFY